MNTLQQVYFDDLRITLCLSILHIFEEKIEKIETVISLLIENIPAYKEKSDLLQSIHGIGKICAASIISNVS